jgi:hypothetical protein
MRVVGDVKPATSTLLFAALVSTGCADREILHHQLDDGASMGEIVERGGNFPEPAVTVCGQLPQGVVPISDLAAAWAVQSTFETWDSPGPYPGIRMRFSDWGFECADDFPSAEGLCETTWAYALTLPADLAPGIYTLDETPGLAYEVKFTVSNQDECIGGEAGGDGGYPPHQGWGGEIEIFAVTPDCIMGEIRGMDIGNSEPNLDPNGGFVAQRCQSTCVPTLGYPC